MTTRPEVNGDQLKWFLDVSVNQILKYKDSVQLAILLTHEARHLKRFHEYDKASGNLTVDQRYTRLLQRAQNPVEHLQEEADAYGIQSKAYVYQTGLMGRRDMGSESYSIALNFIKFGQNSENPSWQQYLQTRGIQY